ncbi:MAG: hypothetical protein U0359_05100 [Byssovorax sp.]
MTRSSLVAFAPLPLLALLTTACSSAPPVAKAASPAAPPLNCFVDVEGVDPSIENEPLVVDAILEETGPEVPHCGVVHFAEVMRYRVIRVKKGQLEGGEVFAIHSCPDWSGHRFTPTDDKGAVPFHVGSLYRLVLDPDAQITATVMDAFKDGAGASPAPRRWVKRVRAM